MKFLLLLLLFILIGCSTNPVQKPAEPTTPTEEPTEIAKPEVKPEVIVVAPTVKDVKVRIIIKSLTGFDAAQTKRFNKIADNCETVINSEEFATKIKVFKWNGKVQFVDTQDSPEKVLTKILSKDWLLEYKLEYLGKFSKTIGYTYPNVTWIALNSKKYPILDDAEVCSNIVHEYGGHKFGRYGHAMKWSESRDYSAPYGLGYTAEKIYYKMFPVK